MTKIMILGGAGFIGSHVVDLLHKNQSNQLFIFDDLSTGRHENVRHLISEKYNTRIKFDMLDVKKREHVDDAFSRFHPEVVILLAAQAAISVSERDPKFDADTNIGGMLNVISASRQFGARRIVFSSTSAVYREKTWGKLKESDFCEPKSPYGISKLASEHYLRTLFQESVVLRFGNVFGPRQAPIGDNQVIPRMIRHFKFGDDFKIFGDGKQTRDYVYVGDVAEAVECAMVGTPGTYNIATGKRLSVNEVARGIEELYEVPGYKWEHRAENDPRRDICLDVRRANEFLGWKPRVSFTEGLKRTKDWLDNGGAKQEAPTMVKIPIAYEVVR
ncbi:MAG: NAD-dependent epimerase/dehydratase family protein [Chloroflexi bacterium]|nr:MAG: NAD-dependent epimerase/dehydratase family protein [Chloroflexota bacterium]